MYWFTTATTIDCFSTCKLAPRYGAMLTAWGIGGIIGPALLPLSHSLFPQQDLLAG